MITGVTLVEITHVGAVTCCAFDSENRVITGGQDNVVRIYDLQNSDELAQSPKLGGRVGVVVSLATASTAQQAAPYIVVTTSSDTTVRVLDMETLAVKYSLQGHSSLVWTVQINQSGKMLGTNCERFINIWSPAQDYATIQTFDLVTLQRDNPADYAGDPTGQPGRQWSTFCFCPSIYCEFVAAATTARCVLLLEVSQGVVASQVFVHANIYAMASGCYDKLLWGDEAGNVQELSLF